MGSLSMQCKNLVKTAGKGGRKTFRGHQKWQSHWTLTEEFVRATVGPREAEVQELLLEASGGKAGPPPAPVPLLLCHPAAHLVSTSCVSAWCQVLPTHP